MNQQGSGFLLGAVVIGRNEGARLVSCLDSLLGNVDVIIYVDSGSTDNSLQEAKKRDISAIELDLSTPFTAARARNAGVKSLLEQCPNLKYIQFIDGDCEMEAGWFSAAEQFLNENQTYVAICGRLRERFPESSIYNKLMDIEWDIPIGDIQACGGIAMVRVSAFTNVGGFREDMIAGEEPEMYFRMRAEKGKVFRLDIEMAKHDAAMTKFSQWWKRSIRAGYAFSEGAYLHGKSKEKYWVRERNSILVWGLLFPYCILIAGYIYPWLLFLFIIYPIQILRVSRNSQLDESMTMKTQWAFFTVHSKFPQAIGLVKFFFNKCTNKTSQIIEYK